MPRLDLTHIILHHTAAEEKDTEQIRRYHLSKGWRDIGYDYVIEIDGKTVAGRSLSIQGAHAGISFYNQHAIGVAAIGNLNKRGLYPLQLESLIILLYDLIKRWHIPLQNILLHSEIRNTSCPGKYFSKDLFITGLEKRFSDKPLSLEKPETYQQIETLLVALKEEKDKNKLFGAKINILEKALKDVESIVTGLKEESKNDRF